MAFSTRVGPTGVITLKDAQGFSVKADTLNYGFGPYKVDAVTAITASTTIVPGNAGVVTLSGSATALTGTMPLASDCPGATFVVRNRNASLAHILTGSAEAAGTQVFSDGYTKGSKFGIAAGANGSVILMCDGANFLLVGGSSGSLATTSASIGAGSLVTISGT